MKKVLFSAMIVFGSVVALSTTARAQSLNSSVITGNDLNSKNVGGGDLNSKNVGGGDLNNDSDSL